MRIESDGELVAVRPLIFHGYHQIRGTVYGDKHAVGYVPVGTDGDRTQIVLELAEVRRRVPYPENWTLTPPIRNTPNMKEGT